MDPSNYTTGSDKPIFWFDFLDLTDQDSFKTYMQAIQVSHTDLLWFKFGDEETLRRDSRKGMQEMGLWADEHEPVRIRDDKSDNFLGQYKASVMIMQPKKQKKTDHQAQYNNAEALARDIISKLVKDYYEGTVATELSEYQFGKATISYESTEFIGCRLDMHWLAPVDIAYREDKWQ